MLATAGDDAKTMALRTTFGLLLSRDGGQSFRWVCEKALGFDGAWDPPIAATKDGRIFVGTVTGLRVTSDGCDVRDVSGLAGELVADLTVDATGLRGVAITSTPSKPAFVYRERVDMTWDRMGKGISHFTFDTIEVSTKRPMRLYLTAVAEDGGGKAAHFFRSDDGGATIVETTPTLEKDGRLFVSGIDPKNESRVFVRQLHQTGSELLLSTDGGAHFKTVLHMNGSMPGFAMSPDGARVYAGGSNPKEGIFRSDDRGEHFEHVGTTSVKCLHVAGEKLFACSDPFPPKGYALAVSTDHGATVTPMTTFEIAGPIVCDAGAGVACNAAWPEVRAAIKATADEVSGVAGVNAGNAGSNGEVDASPSPASSLAAAAAEPAKPRRACGCDVVGGGGSAASRGASGSLFFLAVVFGSVRRRRTWIRRSPTDAREPQEAGLVEP